jgi:hypothetical protein
MKLTARYRKKSDIANRSIAGESFLIPVCGRPVDMENIFVLNPLAAFIWERLDGEYTLEMVITDIIAAFKGEREQASVDANEFIGQLLANELVEEVA